MNDTGNNSAIENYFYNRKLISGVRKKINKIFQIHIHKFSQQLRDIDTNYNCKYIILY